MRGWPGWARQGTDGVGDNMNLIGRLRKGSTIFAILAVAAFGVSMAAGLQGIQTYLLPAAAALTAIMAALHLAHYFDGQASQRRLGIVMAFLEHDAAPGFCTKDDGAIFAQNRAALDRFGPRAGETMTRTLEGLFANPDAVVHRLLSSAQGRDAAREDVVTRRGHVRMALHRIPGGYLWRLEDLVDRPARAADGLALPMLTCGPSGTILFMNEVLREVVGARVKRIRDLFRDHPLRNGEVNVLTTKTGSQRVRLALSEAVDGRQEVFVIPAGEEAESGVALDSLPVALLRLDPDGRIIFANKRAQVLLPRLGDGVGVQLAAMVEGLGRPVGDWVQEAAQGRIMDHPEVVRVTGAATDSFLQVTLGRPLGGDQGGLIAVLNDATELKTMEAQFVQSQKMQAIGQLAGGVAHDFNNLLTAISGHCDLLLLRHGEGDEDNADLLQITQNANRAAALVGQLLAFSRKQTLQMQRIDLRDTLGDLAHLLNRLVGEKVTLQTDHDPALLPIRGDRRQLEQVLMNLVVNARDAMPDGGNIRIETRCRYLTQPLCRDRVSIPAGQFVVVSVIDDGCGIPQDRLSRIFEPFYTTKRPGEGTGLGLSMAYGIVKQSGGYIFADSEEGEGTTFSVYLPADTSGKSAADAVEVEDVDAVLSSIPSGLASGRLDGLTPLLLETPEVSSGPVSLSTEEAMETADGDLDTSSSAAPYGPLEDVEPEDADSSESVPDEVDEIAVDQDSPTIPDALISEVLANAVPAAETSEDSDGFEVFGSDDLGRKNSGMPDGEDEETSGPDMPDASSSLSGRRRVLLVEDEAPVRAFAKRALKLRGFDVLEAASAEEALSALEDDEMIVDLFVTDVIMPGLDGPTWVRQAMTKRPDVRTVFMSGYAQDALSEHAPTVPNAQFLPKPFSLAELTRTVEHALK
ncbi:MAG: ATP-binding protein [Pseudomonadota bacterium]